MTWRIGRLGSALAALLLLIPAVPAAADLEDELDDVIAEIQQIEDDLEAAAAERTGIVAELLAAKDRLEEARASLIEAEDALRAVRAARISIEVDLESTQAQLQLSYESIAETRRRIDAGRVEATQWARSRYIGDHADGSLASSVVALGSVSDLATASFLLDRISEETNAVINRYEALGAEEERQQARIEVQEAQLQEERRELLAAEAQQDELTAERRIRAEGVRAELDTQRTLLAQLDEVIADFTTELDGLAEEQERLERLIRESSGGGGVETPAPGKLVRPVPGAITSAFGPRLHPILGYTRMHTGVDMTAPLGQEIKAGADGTVILATTYGGYGLTVIVDHGGGMTTLYAHQSRVFVSVGDAVDAGEVVGEAGSSGLATGPHLHFEVRIDGTPVDPAGYL